MSSYLREQFQNLLIFRLCFGFLFGIVCVFSFQGTYLALSAIPAEKFIFSARITGKAFAFPAAGDFHSLYCMLICCKDAGGRLSFHTVSGIVFSAARVLTIVFGMGTGVSPGRIATSKFLQLFLR